MFVLYPEFRELQKKSEFERAEWVRKQGKESHFSFITLRLMLIISI